MQYTDRYNSEKYLDMTAYLAMRSIESQERRKHPMREDWIYRRGDIYLANLDPAIGSVQSGRRPVLVLQNDVGNYFCPTVTIVPLSSHYWKKSTLPSHCILENVRGLNSPTLVLGEQLRTLDKRCIIKYIGKVNAKQMTHIEEAIRNHLGFDVPAEIEAP